MTGVVWSLSDKLITQLGYIGVTLYLAKLIGPEAFGLIGMLTIFMLLTESVVNSGFSQALVQRSHSLTDADTSTIFYINIIWGTSIYFILYFSAPWIADFYNQSELIEISRLLFLIVIINSFSVVVRAQLLIRIDFKSQAIASLFSTIISSAIGIYLALEGYSYWSLVWLLLLKTLIQNVCIWLFSRWYPQLIFSMESFKSLFRFGSNLMMAGFVATLVNNLYVALIGRYFNAAHVGYFTQATNLSNSLMQLISSTLQGVTYPIFTSIKEQQERLVSLYKKLIAITMLVSLPALVGFSAIADTFVLLFLGEEWLPSIPIIQIVSLARAITPISSINMNILNAIGRSDLFLKVDIIKLPMTLGTLFIAIPYGIKAVAWAILFNVTISFFINAYYPGKLFGFGALGQLKTAKNYLVSTAIMFVLVRLISIESLWLDLIVSIATGAVVYVTLLLLLKDPMLRRIVGVVTLE